jgi:hypothetical protein
MMNTIGEPHPLEVDIECVHVVIVAYEATVRHHYRLKRFSYEEVVFTVLVERDVSSRERSFGEVIDEKFLA